MSGRISAFILAIVILASVSHAQVPQSHIQGNVPAAKDFQSLLTRDLKAYLKPGLGDDLVVVYELLRPEATQSGVALPKYYVWVKASRNNKPVVAGAARVAAIEKTRFEVTHFLRSDEIRAHPQELEAIFPAPLLQTIRERAHHL